MSEQRILVIGSLNMDLVAEMTRMPVPGETVLGTSVLYIPGGKGANQAFAAAQLGGKVSMLGCVGEDSFGQQLLEGLQATSAAVEGIRRDGAENTGTAMIWVDRDGRNSIVVVPGANARCSREYLEEHDSLFRESDYIVLQMEIPTPAVYYAVERGRQLGKTVVLNPAPMPDHIPPEILRQVDYLTPNETELEKLLQALSPDSGKSWDSLEALQRGALDLAERWGIRLLVTLGEAGAFLAAPGGGQQFPAKPVQAVDTTAAGDCFNAAFVVALAEGRTEEDAVRFANAAASLAVTRKGAQTSIPSRDEVVV